MTPANRTAAADPDPLTAALAELADARADVDLIRRLVATRKAGAAALHVAEYQLNNALNRVKLLGGMPAPEPVAESDFA